MGLMVFYAGRALGAGAASLLLGREATPELEEQIRKAALTVPGVEWPHNIWVHDYGASQSVALHIGLPAEMPLEEAHRLAHEVEQRLEALVKGPVIVHPDPLEKVAEGGKRQNMPANGSK